MFFKRMFVGWRYRIHIDRNDASPMVACLENFGELSAATTACGWEIKEHPQNSHAYLHMIDLCARRQDDLERAEKYYKLGMATLSSAQDVELLDSFYLYTRTVSEWL